MLYHFPYRLLSVHEPISVLMLGVLTSKNKYCMPFVYLPVVVSAVGAGLLITLSSNTSAAQWFGYQILYGFGILHGFGSGCRFRVPQVAAQTVLPFKGIPTGIASTLVSQSLGGSVFVSGGNNFLNHTGTLHRFDRVTRCRCSILVLRWARTTKPSYRYCRSG